MKRTLCLLMLLSTLSLLAEVPSVYFVNAYAGADIYQLEGHSALLVDDGRQQTVYNYGVFDFNSPNFVYRFVKGETDYRLAAYPFAYFMAEYKREGRRLVAHKLALDSAQACKLADMLEVNARPANAVYRYNYVKDNCATRPLRMAELAIGDSILLAPAPFESQSLLKPTFRNVMRLYHSNYPWYQFGIDLALGQGIDRPIDRMEMSFAPVELDAMLANATAGGNRLVEKTIILNDIAPDAAIAGPTPWYLTPMFVSCVALVLALALSIRDFRRHRLSKWFDAVWFGLLGLAGCLLTFLIFVSVHEATSPNWLYIWLNPLCLLVPALTFVRSAASALRLWQRVYACLLLLLLVAWPIIPQSANPAFFPLMLATLARSIAGSFIKPE